MVRGLSGTNAQHDPLQFRVYQLDVADQAYVPNSDLNV